MAKLRKVIEFHIVLGIWCCNMLQSTSCKSIQADSSNSNRLIRSQLIQTIWDLLYTDQIVKANQEKDGKLRPALQVNCTADLREVRILSAVSGYQGQAFIAGIEEFHQLRMPGLKQSMQSWKNCGCFWRLVMVCHICMAFYISMLLVWLYLTNVFSKSSFHFPPPWVLSPYGPYDFCQDTPLSLEISQSIALGRRPLSHSKSDWQTHILRQSAIKMRKSKWHMLTLDAK